MKRIIPALVSIFILSGNAFAATPSLSGGSGLLVMKTADMTEQGGHSMSLFAGEDRFLNGTTRSYDSTISPGYLFAVTEDLEFSVNATYLFDDSTESRLTGAVGSAKYRIVGKGEKGFALAISAYGSLYAREDEGDTFSSGEGIYGGEIHLSHFGEVTNLHLSAGGGRGDVKSFSPERFLSDKLVTVNAGVELKALPELTISLEALGSRYQDLEQDNLVIMPSVKYTSGGQFTVMCGIGYGVRTTDSQPESKILAGFSYEFNPPEKTVPHVSARIDTLTSETNALREEVDGLKAASGITGSNTTLDSLRMEIKDLANRQMFLQEEMARMKADKSVAVPQSKDKETDRGSLRVEVFNASSIPGLAMKVADILKEKGYKIIRVKSLKGSNEAKTVIWHRKEVMYLAVDLGHKIPATQWVKPGRGIPDNIDVRIIVGRDLKFLKK